MSDSDSCCESDSSQICIQEPFIHYNVSSSCYDTSDTTDYCNTRKKFNHPDICTFKTLITPVNALTPYNATVPAPIEFRMRRKNKVVSLQWEPFSGTMAASGVATLQVMQTMANMPPYTIYGNYYLQYNGTLRNAAVVIDPTNVKAQVQFNLNTDGTSTGVTLGDTINVSGGSVSWIVK